MASIRSENLIGGKWVGAASGELVDVTNPATDEVIARVPVGGGEEARSAIDAAHAAFPAWSALPAAERGKLLRKLFDRMLADQDRLAELLTREQGKPLAEAKGEIAYAASFLESAAEEGKRLGGEMIPASNADQRIWALRQPVGVAAAITPWNFPIAMITRKLGPALAAGCTIVVKPAQQTPLSALAFAELAMGVGIPPGVVNFITGDAKAIGQELLSNAKLRKLSFTGSTEIGRTLMQGASQHLLRLSLELGGHAPFIVFEDADLDAAVAGALASKYRNMGQTCICPNRFLIQASVYDAFRAKLQKKLEAMKIGSGLDEGVQIGPLIDDRAVKKVEQHVEDALARGAKLVTGGELADLGSGYTRRFYRPTILDGYTRDMLCAREETFGPVSPLRRFSDEREAIELANDSEFGLAAYFYTRDAARLIRVAEALEYGIVGANDGAVSTAQAPFGGVKHSGFGREGGHFALHEYTSVKYVSVRV
jgi:succinate-semialdehyde dehydrogenase / glutarate-semialdehyde dehydrogenase